jgi:hypothetical protein
LTLRGPLAVVLMIALVVSVAVNLSIAGFAFGRFAGPRPPGPNGDIDRLVQFGIRAFPPEIQKSILDAARDRRPEIKDKLDVVQDARRHMFDAMRADPFDPATLDAAYAEMRKGTSDLQQVGQEIMTDAVAKAPPEVRAQIRPPRGPAP